MNNALSQRQIQIDRVGFGININWNSIDREIIEWASPETVEKERWYVIEGGSEGEREREERQREMAEEQEKLKVIEKWQQKWEREKERMVERRRKKDNGKRKNWRN